MREYMKGQQIYTSNLPQCDAHHQQVNHIIKIGLSTWILCTAYKMAYSKECILTSDSCNTTCILWSMHAILRRHGCLLVTRNQQIVSNAPDVCGSLITFNISMSVQNFHMLAWRSATLKLLCLQNDDSIQMVDNKLFGDFCEEFLLYREWQQAILLVASLMRYFWVFRRVAIETCFAGSRLYLFSWIFF